MGKSIFHREHDAIKTFVHWIEATAKAGVFPLDKLRKAKPYEIEHVARVCEQACCFTDADVAQIERDTGKPYVWKYARTNRPTTGYLFLNPEGGNAYLTHGQTDRAVNRAAQVAFELWLNKGN